MPKNPALLTRITSCDALVPELKMRRGCNPPALVISNFAVLVLEHEHREVGNNQCRRIAASPHFEFRDQCVAGSDPREQRWIFGHWRDNTNVWRETWCKRNG